VTDELAGVDAVDWAALGAAYGPATDVATLLHEVVSADEAVRDRALDGLFTTVWHQGTVYDVSPVVVPFLVAIATDAGLDAGTRTDLCFLLSCVANADSFVLPEAPSVMRLPWWRSPGHKPAPARDLVEECRHAVADHAARLVDALPLAPPLVAAGLLAALAATASYAPLEAETAARRFLDARDPRIAAAAELLRGLALHDVSDERLQELAGLDPAALDLLQGTEEWPVEVRAAQVVLELMAAVTAGGSSSSGR